LKRTCLSQPLLLALFILASQGLEAAPSDSKAAASPQAERADTGQPPQRFQRLVSIQQRPSRHAPGKTEDFATVLDEFDSRAACEAEIAKRKLVAAPEVMRFACIEGLPVSYSLVHDRGQYGLYEQGTYTSRQACESEGARRGAAAPGKSFKCLRATGVINLR
jgi:hypothetical protein